MVPPIGIRNPSSCPIGLHQRPTQRRISSGQGSRCPRFCSAARHRRIDANATSQSHRSTPTTPTTPPARGTRVLHRFLAFGSLPLPPSLSVALAISMPTSLRPLGALRRKINVHIRGMMPPPTLCLYHAASRARSSLACTIFCRHGGWRSWGACMVGRDAKGRKHQASGCGDHRQLSNFMHIAVLGGANARCSLARGMPNTFNQTNCTRYQV